MRITIAERLKPFSHVPGTYFLLPGSNLRVQAFPSFIRLYDLSGITPRLITEFPIGITGPVKDFTVLQDLEQGCLKIWCHTALGYLRYSLRSMHTHSPCVALHIEKQPADLEIAPNPFIQIEKDNAHLQPISERLSLGNHKAQDWTLMNRRVDMAEIFPLWMHLGSTSPNQNFPATRSPSLLNECQKVIGGGDKLNILLAFKNLFLAGFDSGLSPRLHDDFYQGFPLPIIASDEQSSPLQVLVEGSRLIRSLFIQQSDKTIHILPVLPPEFHCGRMLQIACGTTGVCDIEWSKKIIRRIVFTAAGDTTLHFQFQKDVSRFRLRRKESERGDIITCPSSIEMSMGQKYYFDHFEK